MKVVDGKKRGDILVLDVTRLRIFMASTKEIGDDLEVLKFKRR